MERTANYPRLTTLAASVIVIASLYLAKGVLIPFALAMLVSFLLAPLVLRLQRWHFSRIMAVATAVLLVAVLSGGTGWLVVGQVQDVTTKLSEYKHNIRSKMAALRGVVTTPVQSATKAVTDLGADLAAPVEPDNSSARIQTVRVLEPPRGSFELLRDVLSPAVEILTTAAMAMLFAIVMLLRRDDLSDRFIRMAGPGKILVTTQALEEAANKVSRYLWRLLLLNGVHGLAVGIGLACIGVPNALLWGLLSGVLRFIPFAGPWIAAACPVLTSIAVTPGWSQPLYVIGLFTGLELISNNVLEPLVFGTGTGISPLAILASALFWTWLWGPIGLILSTPMTVCLVVMGKYVPQLEFLHLLFSDAPALSPSARLYQRLITGDQDQAWVVLRTELEQKTLHELYDAVVLPALSMAEHDRQRGALDAASEARIEETMRLLLEESAELRAGTDGGAEAGSEGSTDVGAAPAIVKRLRVLCLPARGTADALAATMLSQVLEREGIEVEVSSVAELSGETLELLAKRPVDIVCISAVPPSQFMHVRYLCKRIASRFPKLPIIAGLWTLELETQELADRLPMLAGVHVVTSLRDARTHVRQLAETVRIQREAGLAARPPTSA